MKALVALALTLPLAGALAAAGELRDPMRPPAPPPSAAASRPNLVPTKVTALFISETRRAAVVDGQLVRAGERAGLCYVEEILDDGVRCRFPKSVRVVLLPRSTLEMKKPTATAVAANGVPST
jgi:hypothetical protein